MADELFLQGGRAVAKSFPAPGISFLQPPPGVPEVSRITGTDAVDGHSSYSSSSQPEASKHLKDIHMVS